MLTKAIWKNIAAMAKWLVTNPLGWVILGAGAIFGLVKCIDALTESTEEAGEAATAAKERYNEIESEIDSLNSKIEENNKLIAETNGDAQYDGYRKRLEAENKELERQIELERIKAQEAKLESDGKATKALTSETYEYDVKHTVNATGAGYTTTSQKGDIATATDWYLDQAEATGVVSDKLKDYIETIKEQRENLDLLNPESKELYDNLGLLIDRYIALYPNVKVTSDEMADLSGKVNKMTDSLDSLMEKLGKAKDALSTLDETYAKIYDSESEIGFEDYSNIYETFKDVPNIDGFINQLQDAGQNADEVKKVMESLIEAYIKQSGILDNLTAENADLVASMLEEIGVVNVDAQALAQLALEKMAGNNVKIDTDEDIDELIALANASGASAIAIAKIEQAKKIINSKSDGSAGWLKQYEAVTATIEAIENGTFDFGFSTLDPNDFKYNGGSNTASAKKSAAEKAKKEAKLKS